MEIAQTVEHRLSTHTMEGIGITYLIILYLVPALGLGAGVHLQVLVDVLLGTEICG
jgi:hypothetical protein